MSVPPLSTEEVAERAMELVATRGEELLAESTRRFGGVLSADNAAEIFPDYTASIDSRTAYRAAIHPATQWVRDELLQRALTNPAVKEIIFTAGGNGAGKTIGSPASDIVLDSTFSDLEHAGRLVEQGLNAGKTVIVAYTFRPIEEALVGVLERAQTQGRTVPIAMIIKTHEGSAHTIAGLYERYQGNPNINFRFVDNSSPIARGGTIALTRKQNYRESREQLHAILESKRAEISELVYRATKGAQY